MNLYYYALSMVDLMVSKGRGWVTHELEMVQDAESELPNYEVLFFDIDDTLNADQVGLDEACCKLLNRYAEQYSVVLLTNCSERRAEQHRENIKRYQCQAELWEVGNKPNYPWLKKMILKRGWSEKKCAMFGDRPTMDIWCAYKAGFGGRFWVKSWVRNNTSNSITKRIKRWEWKQMRDATN